jgi:DUF971 family protein
MDQAQVPRTDGSVLTLQFADGKQIQLAAALLRVADQSGNSAN